MAWRLSSWVSDPLICQLAVYFLLDAPQEFKMLQDVAVNESQKDICTEWDLCKEEMLEEGAELLSLE